MRCDRSRGGYQGGWYWIGGGELFLLEKFSKMEDFVDLALWESLDQLIEFFSGGHDFSGVYGVVLILWLNFTCA